jgi:hypothetical protein
MSEFSAALLLRALLIRLGVGAAPKAAPEPRNELDDLVKQMCGGRVPKRHDENEDDE